MNVQFVTNKIILKMMEKKDVNVKMDISWQMANVSLVDQSLLDVIFVLMLRLAVHATLLRISL